ncbi:ComEC/Rec2 family competence protein [Shigella flexneri]
MDPVAILSQSLWRSLPLRSRHRIFGTSGFPVRSWNCCRYCVQLFPHRSAMGITLLLMPVQIVIFHGISLSTSFIANLLAIPLVHHHGSVDPRRDGLAF